MSRRETWTEVVAEDTREGADKIEASFIWIGILIFAATIALAIIFRRIIGLLILIIVLGIVFGVLCIRIGKAIRLSMHCLAEIAYNTQTEENKQYYDD